MTIKILKKKLGRFSEGTSFDKIDSRWYRNIDDKNQMKMDDVECLLLETWDMLNLFETIDSGK